MKTPKYESSLINQVRGRIISRRNRQINSKHKVRKEEIKSLTKKLSEFTNLFPDVSPETLSGYGNDLKEVQKKIGRTQDECAYSYSGTADMSLSWLQYVLCRIIRPELVVETGVWIGGSSLTMLSAMQENKKGRLCSIDFPPFWKSKRVGIGRLVPESLYDRWDLFLGPSKDILGRCFTKESLDIFVHDSDHTYSNMKAEFELAWGLLKSGGYLISDDSSMNDSVLDFCEEKNVDPQFFSREKGGTIALIKRPER